MSDKIKGEVQKQFASNAYKYVTSARHAKGEDLAWLVASSEVNSSMNVLDIATGGGHVANALAPLVSRVTALDLTEEMLQVAQQFIHGNGHTNVEFVAGDAEQLPFPDNTFDRVTSRIAAHHFPDVTAFVKESLRVLKPGGKLLFIDNVAPESDVYDRFYNDIEKWRDPSHGRAWRKSEWILMLEKAGFRIDAMVTFEKPFQFTDWCERAALPAEAMRELEMSMLQAEDQIHKYFKLETSEDGNLLSFEGESVYIQARKPQ